MASIFRFASSAVITQAIALLTGILVVRSLSKDDYALYSICAAIIAALIALSDSGVNSKLLSRLGEIMTIRGDATPVLRAARRVRTITLVGIVPVSCGFELYLLLANGADVSLAILLTALTALAVVPEVFSALARIGLQVHFLTGAIQRAMIGSATVRLISFALIALLVTAASPAVFLAATVVTAIVQAVYLTLSLPPAVSGRHRTAQVDPDENRRFRTAFFSTLPQSLSVIAGEQWITAKLTITGNVSGIAELAALSRFALIFAVANMVVSNVVAPRAAIGSVDRASTQRAVRTIAGSYCILAALFVAGVWLASPLLIGVLGDSYRGLESELLIVCIGYAIANFAAFGVGGVNHARGWVSGSWVYLPLLITWALVCEVTVDPATSMGPAIYSASLALVMLLTQCYRFSIGYRSLRT